MLGITNGTLLFNEGTHVEALADRWIAFPEELNEIPQTRILTLQGERGESSNSTRLLDDSILPAGAIQDNQPLLNSPYMVTMGVI